MTKKERIEELGKWVLELQRDLDAAMVQLERLSQKVEKEPRFSSESVMSYSPRRMHEIEEALIRLQERVGR